MSDETYHIRVRRGHHKRLRFWFAPVDDKIMNARADWLDDAELSCDNICAKEMLYPLIRKHFPGEFQWRTELNLMPFENALKMAKELKNVAKLLKRNYDDPRLTAYKKHFSIDLLVNADEYEEKYAHATTLAKKQAVEERVDLIVEFYRTVADYLEKTVAEYEPKGFHSFAIYAPH
ncbi:MAG: hypothetical protein Q4B09_08910 [Lachnospiraceae bacterium]|nr:hypothetical protein [Lachnospiraceae bacterium]